MNGDREGKHIGKGGAADIMELNKNGVGGALGNAWMDGGNPHGQYNQQLYDAMRGYTYKGADGKQYMINGNYYHGGGYDQEGANTAGDLMFGGVGALGHPDKGRQIGEMSYSVTGFKPDWGGDMGAFNGQGFDMYDKDGKYVGGNLPMSMGDDQMGKTGAMIAAMVATAGLGGAALAGGGLGGMGAGMAGAANPVMAAEAAGLGAAGLGSAGTAGLGGLGAVGSAGGIGGGGAMGVEGIGGVGGMGASEGIGAAGGAGGISTGGAPAGFVGAGGGGASGGGFSLQSLLGGGGSGGGFGGFTMKDLIGLGTSLYGSHKQSEAAEDWRNWMQGGVDKIDGMYKPGSPEYNALWDEMSRKDAAAGRNSQYGPRSVDLAARLTDIKGRLLSGMYTGMAQPMGSSFSGSANAYAGLPYLINTLGQSTSQGSSAPTGSSGGSSPTFTPLSGLGYTGTQTGSSGGAETYTDDDILKLFE
jgi:hypothetical protein